MEQRIFTALLSIFPKCRTLFSEGIEEINVLFRGLATVNKQHKENPDKRIEIPFIRDFEGNSPLHKALEKKNNPAVNFFLMIL
jgi:ankyrin repeat protein